MLLSGKLAALTVVLITGALPVHGQTPGDVELDQAYQARAQKDYDRAIALFRKGLQQQPDNAGAHKDLAYTLLKTGDNAEARDEFANALRLNAGDETAALEFAFLAFETKKPIEARRMFDRLRHKGTAANRATAEQAFENIDKPLAQGIERWKEALARSAAPNDIAMYSAHWELAQLAELRDDLPLAAEQYEICRKLKPQSSELLLILARVWTQLNRMDEAHAALLAASRSAESRTAELGLEQLDPRYPYPYEFLKALQLDPQNISLRRELAFLYLAMHQQEQAIKQFELALAADPGDKLSREQLDALRGFKKRPPEGIVAGGAASNTSSAHVDPKSMGEKSLALGYTRDAIKYLRQAHEENPDDREVMLKLALAYNLAKDDADALPLLDQARHADDPQIASDATKAYRNLNPDAFPQTTVWSLPMYSSRWNDVFTYGQMKRTMPLPWKQVNSLLSFYLSMRLDGDVRGAIHTSVGPGYLSETSVIFGVGAASHVWHHLTGWAEAGEAVNYLVDRHDVAAAQPDYRGGLNFAKGFGSLLGSHTPGLFYETTDDAIYVSRFDKDWLFYSQHRAGRTFAERAGMSTQLLFNVNYLQDVKSQYWANTLEMGPGVKVHFRFMPPNVFFSTDFLRGVYLNNHYNPRRPNYNDVRVSVWFARTTK